MSKKFKVLPQTRWTAPGFWSIEWRSMSVLLLSLAVMGSGEGILLLSDLGSAPWTILSQGVALQGDFSVGWASLIISLLVMLAWFPLKLKLGIATILNVLVIALFLGLTTAYVPAPATLTARFVFAVAGILLFGIGSAFYLTCHQGAGPRDGLMVGLCQRFHWRVGIVRTSIEIIVCLAGFLLGGTVGIGTLMFAFSIGWIMQHTLAFIERSPIATLKNSIFSE
ncbi:YitT family protein [Pasteurellaceae bacterium LIM206]|nr:YitT family protein [Pasteurellaceae bacterium LIM206]